MRIFDPTNTKCFIYTYKAGLLSPFAHDLKLQILKFEIKVDGTAKDASKWHNIVAVFNATSLRAVCATLNGKDNLAVLSKQDRLDIERNVLTSVLRQGEFPRIHFRSKTISGNSVSFRINGELTLCGITKKIVVTVKRKQEGYSAETTLDQRNFGIKPFSALLGAMRVKPEVKVRLTLSLNDPDGQ